MAPGGRRRRALGLLAVWSCRRAAGVQEEALVEDSHATVIPLHGDLQVDGRHYIDAFVGTPPQRLVVALDTLAEGGIAFPCLPCDGCAAGEDLGFQPNASGSAAWRPCDASCSGECHSGRCASRWSLGAAAGDVPVELLQDVLRLGKAGTEEAGARVSRLGCLQTAYSPGVARRANGVLGLRPNSSLLEELYGTISGQEGSTFFSVCLASQGGQLTVNGYNESYTAGPMQWLRMNASETAGYQVSVEGLRVSAQTVDAFQAAVKATLDASSASTYVPSDAYAALTREIERQCASPGGGAAGHCGATRLGASSCWALQDAATGPAKFPTLQLCFAGQEGGACVPWQARSYMAQKGRTSIWCYAFLDSGETGVVTLGASWMLNREVVFDSFQGVLGIASATCPQHLGGGASQGAAHRGRPALAIPPPLPSGDEPPVALPSIASGADLAPAFGDAQDRLRGSAAAGPMVGARVEELTDAEVEALKAQAAAAQDGSGPGSVELTIGRHGRSGSVPFVGSGVLIGFVLALCAGSRGVLRGGPHRQLRETLMDEVVHGGGVGRGRGSGSSAPATASPVELSDRVQDVAEDEQE